MTGVCIASMHALRWWKRASGRSHKLLTSCLLFCPPLPAKVLSRQAGKDTIQLKKLAPGQADELIFIITLTATDPVNPLRALRVLPAAGGICAGSPYKQVASAAACNPPTLYRSYAKSQAEILFMPQFLAGLRPYRWE